MQHRSAYLGPEPLSTPFTKIPNSPLPEELPEKLIVICRIHEHICHRTSRYLLKTRTKKISFHVGVQQRDVWITSPVYQAAAAELRSRYAEAESADGSVLFPQRKTE